MGSSLAVIGTGLVTSVGLSAAASCAAIRAKLRNPTETRFIDKGGEWIMSHSVGLQQPLRGLEKLAHMAAMSTEECLDPQTRKDLGRVPLLLCVAERTRPGRLDGLDDRLFEMMGGLLGVELAPDSAVIPQGRVAVAVALRLARETIYESHAPAALIVATDSLLGWPTLRVLEQQRRLLSTANSNGFIPGEAAAAILVTASTSAVEGLHITGLGFGTEPAKIDSGDPLRGDGLTRAIKEALQDADCDMRAIDFRITDISGEQYYFKEAALAIARTSRHRKEEFDIWHPAECIGEVGSAIGPAMLALADAAARKNYAPGPRVLMHAANDEGQRAAIVTHFSASP